MGCFTELWNLIVPSNPMRDVLIPETYDSLQRMADACHRGGKCVVVWDSDQGQYTFSTSSSNIANWNLGRKDADVAANNTAREKMKDVIKRAIGFDEGQGLTLRDALVRKFGENAVKTDFQYGDFDGTGKPLTLRRVKAIMSKLATVDEQRPMGIGREIDNVINRYREIGRGSNQGLATLGNVMCSLLGDLKNGRITCCQVFERIMMAARSRGFKLSNDKIELSDDKIELSDDDIELSNDDIMNFLQPFHDVIRNDSSMRRHYLLGLKVWSYARCIAEITEQYSGIVAISGKSISAGLYDLMEDYLGVLTYDDVAQFEVDELSKIVGTVQEDARSLLNDENLTAEEKARLNRIIEDFGVGMNCAVGMNCVSFSMEKLYKNGKVKGCTIEDAISYYENMLSPNHPYFKKSDDDNKVSISNVKYDYDEYKNFGKMAEAMLSRLNGIKTGEKANYFKILSEIIKIAKSEVKLSDAAIINFLHPFHGVIMSDNDPKARRYYLLQLKNEYYDGPLYGTCMEYYNIQNESSMYYDYKEKYTNRVTEELYRGILSDLGALSENDFGESLDDADVYVGILNREVGSFLPTKPLIKENESFKLSEKDAAYIKTANDSLRQCRKLIYSQVRINSRKDAISFYEKDHSRLGGIYKDRELSRDMADQLNIYIWGNDDYSRILMDFFLPEAKRGNYSTQEIIEFLVPFHEAIKSDAFARRRYLLDLMNIKENRGIDNSLYEQIENAVGKLTEVDFAKMTQADHTRYNADRNRPRPPMIQNLETDKNIGILKKLKGDKYTKDVAITYYTKLLTKSKTKEPITAALCQEMISRLRRQDNFDGNALFTMVNDCILNRSNFYNTEAMMQLLYPIHRLIKDDEALKKDSKTEQHSHNYFEAYISGMRKLNNDNYRELISAVEEFFSNELLSLYYMKESEERIADVEEDVEDEKEEQNSSTGSLDADSRRYDLLNDNKNNGVQGDTGSQKRLNKKGSEKGIEESVKDEKYRPTYELTDKGGKTVKDKDGKTVKLPYFSVRKKTDKGWIYDWITARQLDDMVNDDMNDDMVNAGMNIVQSEDKDCDYDISPKVSNENDSNK